MDSITEKGNYLWKRESTPDNCRMGSRMPEDITSRMISRILIEETGSLD